MKISNSFLMKHLRLPGLIALSCSVWFCGRGACGADKKHETGQKPEMASARSTTVSAWRLFLITPSGKMRAIVTHSSMCLDNGVFRYLIAAPNWDRLMIISDEQELYYPATIAQYRADWFSDTGLLPGSKKGASKPDAVARERLPRQENEPVVRDCSLEMIGCEAKLGFPCKHYSGPYLRGSVDLWYTTGFDLDEHLAAAACRLLGVKPESGVPVLCLIRNRRHQIVERYVKVLRAERCRVPASQILVPRAYRLARDQAELLFADGAGNPDLERLFQVSPVSSSKTSSSRPRQKDPGSGNSGSSKPNFKVHPSSKVTNSNNPG